MDVSVEFKCAFEKRSIECSESSYVANASLVKSIMTELITSIINYGMYSPSKNSRCRLPKIELDLNKIPVETISSKAQQLADKMNSTNSVTCFKETIVYDVPVYESGVLITLEMVNVTIMIRKDQ